MGLERQGWVENIVGNILHKIFARCRVLTGNAIFNGIELADRRTIINAFGISSRISEASLHKRPSPRAFLCFPLCVME